MRQLIMNDGTIINGDAGLADGFLWLWMQGVTMQEAAAIAFDKSKTRRIIFKHGEAEEVYTGYTVCTNIKANNGETAVCMVKG